LRFAGSGGVVPLSGGAANGWLAIAFGWLPSMAPISRSVARSRGRSISSTSLLNGLFGTFIMAVLRHRIRWTWLAALAWMVVVGLLFDETSHIDAGLARWLFTCYRPASAPCARAFRPAGVHHARDLGNFVTAAVFTLDPARAFGACLPATALSLLGLAGWRHATRHG
jgi:hypothetical protein